MTCNPRPLLLLIWFREVQRTEEEREEKGAAGAGRNGGGGLGFWGRPRALVGGLGAGREGAPRCAVAAPWLSAGRCGNEGRRWGPLAEREKRESGAGPCWLAARRARGS